MELEMFVNGKFIDSVSFTPAQIKQIHLLQKKLERKHCHSLEYADDQPQYFITGIPENLDFEQKEEIRDALAS